MTDALAHLPDWGLYVAPDFPIEPFNDMLVSMAPLPDESKGYLMRAWVAVANRNRTCYDQSVAFADGLDLIPDDAYHYEAALFAFLTAGLSALECIGFGVHAIGFGLQPNEFPMSRPEDQRKVGLELVHKRYSKEFPSEPLTTHIGNLLKASEYQQWSALRNYVTHRSVTGRHITAVIGGPPVPDKIREFGYDLVPGLTVGLLAWLNDELRSLLRESESFVSRST